MSADPLTQSTPADMVRAFNEWVPDRKDLKIAEQAAELAGLRLLRAEKDKFETALRSIAANTCCDGCREAALVAKEALGE